jgi:hypothetical protein
MSAKLSQLKNINSELQQSLQAARRLAIPALLAYQRLQSEEEMGVELSFLAASIESLGTPDPEYRTIRIFESL